MKEPFTVRLNKNEVSGTSWPGGPKGTERIFGSSVTKISKKKLVDEFADYYKNELQGEVAPEYLKHKGKRVMSKIFTYFLLKELSKDNDFSFVPLGRNYPPYKEYQSLQYAEVLGNRYSRLHALILQDLQTGISFIIDAGGEGGTIYQAPGKKELTIENKDHIDFRLISETKTSIQLGKNENTKTIINIPDFKKDLQSVGTCCEKLKKLLDTAAEKARKHIGSLSYQGGLSQADIAHLQVLNQNTIKPLYAQMSRLAKVTQETFDAAIAADTEHKNRFSQIQIDVTRDTDFSSPINNQEYVSAFVGRETITLNPEDKTIVAQCEQFQDLFSSSPSRDTIEKLKAPHDMMRKLFAQQKLDPALVEDGKPVALTDFIAKKQGVCRHIALLGAHFIGKLVEDKLLAEGKVTHYRSTTLDLRSHTLVIYQPSSVRGVSYLIDYAQNVFERVQTQADYERCLGIYRDKGLPGVLDRFGAENSFLIPTIEGDQPLGERVISSLETKANNDTDFSDFLTDQELLCPITGEVMRDPVMVNKGKTYERAALDEWRKNHNTCPMTRQTITSVEPNYATKKQIFDLAVGEDGSGILPEEIYLTDNADLSSRQTVKTKTNIDFGIAFCELTNHTSAGEAETIAAFRRLTANLTPLAKDLKKNPTPEAKEAFLTVLHSEDQYLESDVTGVQVLKNLALCVGLLVVGYFIVSAINFQKTGRFLFFPEQNENDKKITDLHTSTYFLKK